MEKRDDLGGGGGREKNLNILENHSKNIMEKNEIKVTTQPTCSSLLLNKP